MLSARQFQANVAAQRANLGRGVGCLHSRPLKAVGGDQAAAASTLQADAGQASTPGLIFGKGATGSWDEAGVGRPVVRCYIGDNEDRWLMWYCGRDTNAPAVDIAGPSSGSVGVAVSTDGIEWARGDAVVEGSRGADAASDVGVVVAPNKDWWTLDTCHLYPSDVQVLSNSSVSSGVGVYWMFYSGGDYEPVPVPEGMPGAEPGQPIEGLRMRPGLAMSQDGKNWARIEAEHHTGALFDVGEPGSWDELFVAGPQVLAVGPKDMRMYYYSWSKQAGRYLVGLAASPDGFRWARKGVVFDPAAGGADPDAFDALGAAGHCVVRDVDNKQYLMFYEGVARDGARSIGLAVSKDGFAWKRCPQPVLSAASAEPGAWDAGGVGAPCAVSMSAGKWRLYYCGKSAAGTGPWDGIGLARSEEGGATFEGVPITFKRRQQ